jgi:hypothetical protein
MNAVAGLNDTFARIGLTILHGAGRRLSHRTQHETCGKPLGAYPDQMDDDGGRTCITSAVGQL